MRSSSSSSRLWWRWWSSSSSMMKPDNRLLPPFPMFSSKNTPVVFISRLSFVLFFFLFVSLLAFPSLIHRAKAEVGLNFGSEHYPVPMDMRGKVWRMIDGACFLGPANNLVVDPVFRPSGNDFMKPQELNFSHTGPRLCHWLDQLYEAHEALRYRWEAAHQKQKSKVSSFNIFKRAKNAMTSFPEFTIRVTAMHLELFHDDWYGHPLPWMKASFAYRHPEKGYGLFSNLIGSVFSIVDDAPPSSRTTPTIPSARRSREHVYILLAPPPTFNQPVVFQKAGKGSLVSGLVAGIGLGASIAKSNNQSTLGQIIDVGQLVYAAFKHVLVFQFSLKDFWLDGTTCRLLTRFQVKATLGGLSLCQFLAGAGSENLWGLYKSEKMKTVEVQITGVNFFNGRYPVLKGIVTEGQFLTDVNDVPIALELNPDPSVIPSYVRTVRATRKVRLFKTVGKFVLQALQFGLKLYDLKNKQTKAGGGADLFEDF